jgi:hypothetical protein
MPYRVLFHGNQVICDTAKEVENLLSKDSQNGSSMADSSQDLDDRQQKARIIASLSRLQRRFLGALANNRDLSDAQARDLLGLSTNKKLAGTLTAITRKFSGANLPNMVRTEKSFKDGSRIYLYWLHSADAKLIREILSDEEQR